MTLKNSRAAFLAMSSLVEHFKAIGKFNLELQSENAQFGFKIGVFFCSMWPWNLMDDLEKWKGNSSMLHQVLCTISLPFVNSGRSYGPETVKMGLTSVTLTFDLWAWPLTSEVDLLSLVITPEISSWYNERNKSVTDRWTDRQTDRQMGGWSEPVIELFDCS